MHEALSQPDAQTRDENAIAARRAEEKAALRPVLASIIEAGHDPHPPHRADFYSNDFLIACRTCGARVDVTLTRLPSSSSDTGYARVAEVTHDTATAIECRGERSYGCTSTSRS